MAARRFQVPPERWAPKRSRSRHEASQRSIRQRDL